MQRPLILIMCLAATACLARPPASGTASVISASAPAPAPCPPQDLSPAAWQKLSPAAFEAWLPTLQSAPAVDATNLEILATLAAADDEPARALEAALILAAVHQAPATTRLVEQLEARHSHPERYADAADVTAAAALGRSRFAAELHLGARLAALAAPNDETRAHPDLEVRTECARAALALGHDEVADLLLRLTRLGTALGRARDGDWHSATTTTWSRNRAAETLAESLGIACPYHGDASLAAREQAALTLEAAWLSAHP